MIGGSAGVIWNLKNINSNVIYYIIFWNILFYLFLIITKKDKLKDIDISKIDENDILFFKSFFDKIRKSTLTVKTHKYYLNTSTYIQFNNRGNNKTHYPHFSGASTSKDRTKKWHYSTGKYINYNENDIEKIIYLIDNYGTYIHKLIYLNVLNLVQMDYATICIQAVCFNIYYEKNINNKKYFKLVLSELGVDNFRPKTLIEDSNKPYNYLLFINRLTLSNISRNLISYFKLNILKYIETFKSKIKKTYVSIPYDSIPYVSIPYEPPDSWEDVA
jgi:hypothetical protein